MAIIQWIERWNEGVMNEAAPPSVTEADSKHLQAEPPNLQRLGQIPYLTTASFPNCILLSVAGKLTFAGSKAVTATCTSQPESGSINNHLQHPA